MHKGVGGVAIGDGAGEVVLLDAVGDGFQERAVFGLAVAEGMLGLLLTAPFARRHVFDDSPQPAGG